MVLSKTQPLLFFASLACLWHASMIEAAAPQVTSAFVVHHSPTCINAQDQDGVEKWVQNILTTYFAKATYVYQFGDPVYRRFLQQEEDESPSNNDNESGTSSGGIDDRDLGQVSTCTTESCVNNPNSCYVRGCPQSKYRRNLRKLGLSLQLNVPILNISVQVSIFDDLDVSISTAPLSINLALGYITSIMSITPYIPIQTTSCNTSDMWLLVYF